MEDEAAPFVSHLGLELVKDFFPAETPFKAYRGKHESCDVTVVTNGQDAVYGKSPIYIHYTFFSVRLLVSFIREILFSIKRNWCRECWNSSCIASDISSSPKDER